MPIAFAVLCLTLAAGDSTAIPPLSVRELAGRVFVGGETYFLESGPNGSRLVRFAADGRLLGAVVLSPGSTRLDSAGLAMSSDGLLWALGDKGTVLIGFDPVRGAPLDVRPLPIRGIAVWSVEGQVMAASFALRGGQPFLYRMTDTGFESCGALRSRVVNAQFDGPLLSMFACGASKTPVLPCWWLAGDAAIVSLRRSCASKTTAVPSLVVARTNAQRGSDPIERFDYPIRDIFSLDDHHAWLLTNQEGSRSPASENSVAGRHALLIADGRLDRSVPLRQRASFIIGGDLRSVVVLYTDGTIERIILP
jgi:hypothetical protein